MQKIAKAYNNMRYIEISPDVLKYFTPGHEEKEHKLRVKDVPRTRF